MHESKKDHNSGITSPKEKNETRDPWALLFHLSETAIAYRIYYKYHKYWDTLSTYHSCP